MGRRHTLRECWEYVTGRAETRSGTKPGVRDKGNERMKPEDFRKRINDFIDERRAATDTYLGNLPVENAHLTLDEVP